MMPTIYSYTQSFFERMREMHQSIIIIDSFLNNAEEIRERGLNMDFPVMEEISNFPGRNSLQRLNVDGMDEMISNIIGSNLKPMTEYSHGKFRLTLANDKGKAKVHLDNSKWSGILYLSRPEDCKGGTDFYRHKATNTDSTLLTKDELTTLGWDNTDIANREINAIIKNDSNDESKWEHIMQVPMKFNRLLLMRPWLWHTAGPGFGLGDQDGRLVYLLFYEDA